MVVIFAEGIFEEESHVTHPPANMVSNTMRIPLYPIKDIPIELDVQAFISLPGSQNFHIFEVATVLPSFSSYLYVDQLPTPPVSTVTFAVRERIQRVALWISENFLIPRQIECVNYKLTVSFIALRGGCVTITMKDNEEMVIATDDMDLAGSLIQSLALFLNLEDLQVTADFPKHVEEITEIMGFIDNLHAVTQKLAAEMTDHSNLIRSLVVRTEDARLLEDIPSMRKGYLQLEELNRELMDGYKLRCTNHQELVKSVKMINQMIQKAAQLRVGRYQAEVISQCRDAFKNSQVSALCKIIQLGSP